MKHFAVTVYVLCLYVLVSGCESEDPPQLNLNIRSETKKSLNQHVESSEPVGDTGQANPVSGKAARKQISFLPIPRDPRDLNRFQATLKQKGEKSSLITFIGNGSTNYNLTLTRKGEQPVNFKDVFVHFIEDIGTVDLDGLESEVLFFVSGTGGSGAEQRDLYLLSPQKKELLSLTLIRVFNATKPIPDVSTSLNFNEAKLTPEREFLKNIKYEYGYIGEKDLLKQQQNPKYASYFWAEDNSKVQDGKLKIRRYKGRSVHNGGSVKDELQDGNMIYRAYFKTGAEAYDKHADEHFVIFHPESVYDWPQVLKKAGPYLFIGTRGEGLVIVNVKTWYLKQDESLGDVRNIEILDSKIRINETTEIPFPSF